MTSAWMLGRADTAQMVASDGTEEHGGGCCPGCEYVSRYVDMSNPGVAFICWSNHLGGVTITRVEILDPCVTVCKLVSEPDADAEIAAGVGWKVGGAP